MVYEKVSPKPNAAVMIRLASMSPNTISADCARRRGMGRRPSLNITGRRQATRASTASTSASAEPRHPAIVVIERPKSLSIG
jgi:hypothetical protein